MDSKMKVDSKPKKFLSRMEEAYQFGASVVEYELPTKIGYWDEKLAIMYEKMLLIKNKRARLETLTIRKNMMFESLNKPISLHEPNQYIHYGDAIQIATDDMQTSALGVQSAVLATIITESDIDATVNLCHGCPVVASHSKTPCRRNVMTIVHQKHGRNAERITYGSDIYICVLDSGTDKTLYLQALVSSLDNFGGANEHYPLRLCELPDRFCKFKIVHWNPDVREVVLGDDIPSNTRVCIAHTVSNRFLVTENKYVPSLFGSEMEVSCYIYKQNQKESPANYWELAIEKQETSKE